MEVKYFSQFRKITEFCQNYMKIIKTINLQVKFEIAVLQLTTVHEVIKSLHEKNNSSIQQSLGLGEMGNSV